MFIIGRNPIFVSFFKQNVYMRPFLLFIILLNILFNLNVNSQNSYVPERPKLIIGIVVEGMRYDYLLRYWDKYGDKGFKKLISKGVLCENAQYDYLITQSSVGYSTIVTGTQPSEHGIVGDYWQNRFRNDKVYCVEDRKVKSIGDDSISIGKSPKQMFVSTFADELKISDFKLSKVIGISPKDYAAVLSAGHLGNGAYWIDKKTGSWVSSSYYTKQLPYWVRRFNEKKIADIYLSKEWSTLLLQNKYTASLSDNNSYEKGFSGNSRTFPYNLQELRLNWEDYDLLTHTPFGNTYTKDFAISAVVNEDLGKDDYPDFLSISFTANANISKLFGIRSIEIEDAYLRLDKDLEHFLNFIDDYIGHENVLIFLTSDRGDNDSPEFLKGINMPGGYINMKSTMSLTKSYLRAVYKKGGFIQSYYDNQIYLDRSIIEDSHISLSEVQQKTASFLINFKGITHVITSLDLDTKNYTKGALQKAQNGYQKKRSGDIIINLAPGYRVKGDNNSCSGYRYYTHVPLIWYGWRIKKGKIKKPVSIIDIAPTISDFMKISYPNASTGKPIEGLLR